MAISVFDIFKIGIGPSSSHTVGPMNAARSFVLKLQAEGLLQFVMQLSVELHGSLAATGRGHGTNKAVLLGLEGEHPEQIDPDCIAERIEKIHTDGQIFLLRIFPIRFSESKHLHYRRKPLPFHANGMRMTAFDAKEKILLQKEYYSIGGGFIISDTCRENLAEADEDFSVPYAFGRCDELLKLCMQQHCAISQIMMNNEKARLGEDEIRSRLLNIWHAMQACVQRGFNQPGLLPGGLKVKRRAMALYQQLTQDAETSVPGGVINCMDWVDLYALAVSEENAAGGKVVTAPTNGAAGIIPAVLHYYWRFCDNADDDAIIRFLLTAGAIAILYKRNASISGAEVGCQGEVGVACSMAAGALAEVLGGSPEQVENAAEIGMEHNLGLTCDPIGGLVQIPCIERNAMGAVKAINAARIALRGDGSHFVSLDKVIQTMRQTGADMKTQYKETSRGGLAVNMTEC